MPNKRRKSHRLQPTTRCEASSKNPHPSGSTRPATLPHPHCRPPNTTEYDESEYAALPLNQAMFPNCLCDNSVRDATYDEVYGAISNTVHINGFRCRRACSVPSLMFHRVNRTSRYPRGWFGVVGQAPLPAGGFVRGTRFVVQSLMRLGVGGSRSGRASVRVESRCKNIARWALLCSVFRCSPPMTWSVTTSTADNFWRCVRPTGSVGIG
jgi:hypothetical protein